MDRVVRQPDGYYIHTNGTHINAHHSGGLKGVINEKMAPQQQSLHQSSTSKAPTAFNSFVEVTQIEEKKEYVWGAMVELEQEAKEVEGLMATRMQEKKNVERRITREIEENRIEKKVIRQENKEVKQLYQPVYHCEPRIANPEASQQILQNILDIEVPNIKVHDLLALSGDLRREMVDQTHTQNKAPTVGATLLSIPEVPLEFATLLREVKVIIMGRCRELGLLDEGSEIVIVQEDLCDELGLKVNKERKMTMQTVNGGTEKMIGCIEYLELEAGGVKTYAHAFVVQLAPYRLLLGRPWQKGIKLGKIERADGSVEVEILDPGEEGKRVVVPTRERMSEQLRNGMMILRGSGEIRKGIKIRPNDSTLTETILSSSFTYDDMAHCLAYKRVADKIQPVPGTMPSDVRIIRKFPEDPLKTLACLSPHPVPFSPGVRLTRERMDELGLLKNKFLWSEERKLVTQVLLMNEKGLA